MTQTATYTEQQFIADMRETFASSRDPVHQAHAIAGLLRRAFESGWPENSEKFGDGEGTFEVYRDTEYGHPRPRLRRAHVPPGAHRSASAPRRTTTASAGWSMG